MNFLEERIVKDGIVKEGNVLKVDSFLNHQMDIELFNEHMYKLINGEEVVSYNSETDSSALVYQQKVDEILGIGLAFNKNIIDEAIKKTEEINKEIITTAVQTD